MMVRLWIPLCPSSSSFRSSLFPFFFFVPVFPLHLPLPHSFSFILYHLQPSQNTPALSSSSFSLIQFIYGLKGGIRLWPSLTSAVLRPVGVCENVFLNVCFYNPYEPKCVHSLVCLFMYVCEFVRRVYSCQLTCLYPSVLRLCVSGKRWQSGHWKEIQPLSFQVKTSSKSIKVQIPHLW